MPEHTTEIVTLGEAMRLLVAEPGVALRRATTFRASIAGAETNVAIGLARQGFAVRWLGRVGADAAGAAVLAQLRADGVDIGAVEVDAERPTGLMLRDSHPTRPIDVQYYRAGSAATALSADYVRHHGLGGVRLVHVTGITAMLSDAARGAVEAIVDLARADGVPVSFDPNVRRKLGAPEQWRSVLMPLLRKADLIFAGTDELELVTGGAAADATTMLLDGGARAVLLKHADKSACLTTPAGEWRLPSCATTVVDPVGAGDALVAGYLAAWLRDAPPEQALAAGVVTAALVVGAVTDTEGLPDVVELDRAVLAFADGGADVVDR